MAAVPTPTSPKTHAALIYGLAVPAAIFVVGVIVSFAATQDGLAFIQALPRPWPTVIGIVVAALAARFGAYLTPDPLRTRGELAGANVPANADEAAQLEAVQSEPAIANDTGTGDVLDDDPTPDAAPQHSAPSTEIGD